VTDPLTPVLSNTWDHDRAWTIEAYERAGGYQALRRALDLPADQVIEMVKDSGLRGRGGAGFPTGTKWAFIPQDDGPEAKPHYLVVNADESEPGTCKDIPLMLASPHLLIEGAIIAAYAIRATHAFIYVRGEVLHVVRRLQQAAEEARLAGYVGRDVLGSGFDVELIVHVGAGAYICGEETALLDSLEGLRGQPRLRPPFPAIAGLYASPTVINNVESIASVPSIIANGAQWFASMGTEKSKGMTLYSLSGHVTRPGQYEAPLGVTLRELLDLAGGVRAGHQLKFWTPGGSSTPLLTEAHLDVPLDYEAVVEAGSMLGTKALQIFDETTCVVRAVLRWTEFYKHESCGKCTPCREGTWWLVQILQRIEAGEGTETDIATLLDLCDNILGRAFCALGDGATSPITSSIQLFKDEYLAHVGRGCPFDPVAATLFDESELDQPGVSTGARVASGAAS
jgi:NADH-quinone oxidoreductase subunit F